MALGILNTMVLHLWLYLRYWWNGVHFPSAVITFDRLYQVNITSCLSLDGYVLVRISLLSLWQSILHRRTCTFKHLPPFYWQFFTNMTMCIQRVYIVDTFVNDEWLSSQIEKSNEGQIDSGKIRHARVSFIVGCSSLGIICKCCNVFVFAVNSLAFIKLQETSVTHTRKNIFFNVDVFWYEIGFWDI